MSTSFPIGRVLGIPIRVHLSWFIVLFIVTGTVSGQYFPDRDPIVAMLGGLAGALLLFASVLLHELGHCVLARYYGIHVRQIQLFIFGGVAEILGEPRRVHHEIVIAAAGPAVSFALAFLSGTLALQLGIAGLEPSTSTLGALASFLFVMNLSLGLVNLIPAFPTDGGRIFRAILWKVLGDYRRATAWAAAAGMAFAGALVAMGAWQALSAAQHVDVGGARLGGIWMVFIGLFLVRSAAQAKRSANISASLREGAVSDVMVRVKGTVTSDVTLLDAMNAAGGPSAADLLLGFPVTESAEITGFVEPARIYALPPAQWSKVTVREMMTPLASLPSVQIDEPLDILVRILTERSAAGALVFHGRDLVGYASRTDVGRWLLATEIKAA